MSEIRSRKTQKKTQEKINKKQEEKKESVVIKLIDFIFNFHKFFANPNSKPFNFTLIDALLMILATCLSVYTHFNEFGLPNTVVFDEVYFGNFTNYYLNGNYFFDIHPPLGKELLYLGAKLSGYNGSLKFTEIAQNFPNDNIKLIRFWPALAGTLITPIVYLILRLCDCSYGWSCVCSMLPALDNAMLVESRFVLIDAFLWLFAVLTVLFCALTIRCPNHAKKLALIAGFAAGATACVKFTGAGVSIGIVIGFFMHFPFFRAFLYSFIAALGGIFVFFSSFIIHFMLLDKEGPGCRYHRRQFCLNLVRGTLDPIKETFALIKTMLNCNFAINQPHPYASKWWTWPLQLGYGNWMWYVEDKQLWCVGTPVVWYFAFFGLLLFIIRMIKNKNLARASWIVISYLISYLPFGLIKRAMWNYHYIIPLELSLLAGALAFNSFESKIARYVLPLVLLVAALWNYLILIPVTYGHSITEERFHTIMFDRWHY